MWPAQLAPALKLPVRERVPDTVPRPARNWPELHRHPGYPGTRSRVGQGENYTGAGAVHEAFQGRQHWYGIRRWCLGGGGLITKADCVGSEGLRSHTEGAFGKREMDRGRPVVWRLLCHGLSVAAVRVRSSPTVTFWPLTCPSPEGLKEGNRRQHPTPVIADRLTLFWGKSSRQVACRRLSGTLTRSTDGRTKRSCRAMLFTTKSTRRIS